MQNGVIMAVPSRSITDPAINRISIISPKKNHIPGMRGMYFIFDNL